MSIKRLHVGPRLSQVAIHGDTVYTAGIVADDTNVDVAGQTGQILDKTFLSSLDLAQNVMLGLDIAQWEARDATETFRRHDERQLESQHAVYHDETQLIQTSKDAHKELEGIFDADAENQGRATGGEGRGSGPFSPSDVR